MKIEEMTPPVVRKFELKVTEGELELILCSLLYASFAITPGKGHFEIAKDIRKAIGRSGLRDVYDVKRFIRESDMPKGKQ